MGLFVEGISKAWSLIVSLDAEVLAVTLLETEKGNLSANA